MSIPSLPVLWLLRALVSAFLAILFVQSGLDKVFDWRGNLAYHTEHFAKSPLAPTVTPMLLVITVIEVTAGLLSAIGCIVILIGGAPTIALYGAVVAAAGLTALFFGQRVSKDYVGAAVLVPYFLLAIAAIWILGMPM